MAAFAKSRSAAQLSCASAFLSIHSAITLRRQTQVHPCYSVTIHILL